MGPTPAGRGELTVFATNGAGHATSDHHAQHDTRVVEELAAEGGAVAADVARSVAATLG